jgi:hypothetical protein
MAVGSPLRGQTEMPPSRLYAVASFHEPVAHGDASHAFSDRPLQNSERGTQG